MLNRLTTDKPSPDNPARADARAATGISGLDDILAGGLPAGRFYLVQGYPGVGKTTLALQFLLHGVAQGESCLYVPLSESDEELRANAASHGWSLEGLQIYAHSPIEPAGVDTAHTLFHPDEVDLSETVRALIQEIERVRPQRLVLDSLSELRLLAGGTFRYRREVLALKDYFAGRDCTVLLLDDRTAEAGDLQLQSICHGVLLLEEISQSYGADRRRLRVTKMRGLRFRSGYHDYAVETGGLQVYPRLVAAEHRAAFKSGLASTGVASLDALLGGGFDRGTTTLLMGPSGTGKSSIATRCAVTAAERGERVAMYVFDERLPTLFSRAAGLGMDLRGHVDAGRVSVQAIDPAELSPGEFASHLRDVVVREGVSLVIIDSLAGYLHAMPETRYLVLQLHEMLTYLGQQGVTTLMVVSQHGMLASAMTNDVDVSYMADNVLLFRFYEYLGEVRQALSVFKRRAGAHERTIRRLTLGGPEGIAVGEPLREFRGVLTGVPLYEGETIVRAEEGALGDE